MVIDDIFTRSKEHEKGIAFAGPIERTAAGLIDLLVVIQVALVLMVPLELKIEAAKLLGLDELSIWGRILQLAMLCLAWLVYQTLSLHLFKATVGMYLFKLRLRPMPIQHRSAVFSATDCLIRSLLMLGSMLLMGFPLLGVYRHPNRRTAIDLVTHTAIVYIDPKKKHIAPDWSEKAFAETLKHIGLMMLGVALGLVMAIIQGQFESSETVAHSLDASDKLCPVVSEVMPDWQTHSKKGETESRLSIALALAAADLIESDCLQKEASLELWTDKNVELGYFAMAYSNRQDPEAFEAYSKKVCQTNAKSPWCGFLQKETVSQTSYEEFATNLPEGAPTFWRITLAEHFIYEKDAKTAEAFLTGHSPHPVLAWTWSLLRAEAFLQQGKTQDAKALLAASQDYTPQSQKLDFLAKACQIETSLGCPKAASDLCKQMASLDSLSLSQMRKDEHYVGLLRAMRCEKVPVNLDAMTDPGNEALHLALRLLQTKDAKKLNELLAEVDSYIEDNPGEDASFIELLTVRTALVTRAEELRGLREQWKRLSSDEPYLASGFGHELREKSGQLKVLDAVEIGNRLPASETPDAD